MATAIVASAASAAGGLAWIAPGSALAVSFGASGMSAGLLLAAIIASRRNTIQTSSSEIVPEHFAHSFDGLADGVLMLDRGGRIALANEAFCGIACLSHAELIGQKALEFGWKWCEVDESQHESDPVDWLPALRDGRIKQGRLLGQTHGEPRIFTVKVVPVLDGRRASRGALVSLHDVTQQNKKRSELSSLWRTLKESSERIRQQHLELEQLASCDTLTGTHNRRSCFDFLQRYWSEAKRYRDELACVMVDVDNFREINDRFDNNTADDVLKKVALTLRQAARDCDVVCRYGGEEFVVIMPRTTLEDAALVAERFRHAVSRISFSDFHVTVSLGVSALSEAPPTPQALLQQTERALVRAKQAGRNQVVRYDALTQADAADSRPGRNSAAEQSCIIPFPAVTALLSSLAYRDVATASHSRRVADLCVAVGQRTMSMSSCYVLETAALLHDIGKIGVPDAILLKPTELTAEEWHTMRAHDRIGLEIIRTSFGADELSEIVEQYTRRLEDAGERSIPLGARILAVADAYDSMVMDKPYRRGLSGADAIAELRRCAGTQFDPGIVEQLVEVLHSRGRDHVVRMDVDRETALALGLELERLAEAVDQQDLNLLKALAARLSLCATRTGATEIAAKAIELEHIASAGDDLLGVLRCANELLSYCRATQSTYVTTNSAVLRGAERPLTRAASPVAASR